MAYVNYICVNQGCELEGIDSMYDSSLLSGPPLCPACGEPMVTQEDLGTSEVPEAGSGEQGDAEEAEAGEDADQGTVAQVSGPIYGGHSLLMGDHDGLPPPRQPRRRGTAPAPPPPDPGVPRTYGGVRLTDAPLDDNGHVRQLVSDLRRLGYWGPRARRDPHDYFEFRDYVLNGQSALRGGVADQRPEVFDFYIAGSVIALKADLKHRYGLTDVPYTTPTRPEHLERLATSTAFCEGMRSAIGDIWAKLMLLRQPVRGSEVQVRRQRTTQLDDALEGMRVQTRRDPRLRRRVVSRSALPDLFSEIMDFELLPYTPVSTGPLRPFALRAATHYTDGLCLSARNRRSEAAALPGVLNGVYAEATATTRSGASQPWPHEDELRELIHDLDPAVGTWADWFCNQMETVRPYLTELILLGSVDNAPAGESGATTTATRIRQMLSGSLPGVTDPVFRVPRDQELAIVPETGQRDIVVATKTGSGRNLVITPNPQARPVLESLAGEAGASSRAPATILVSYVSHESAARHTERGTGLVIYGLDWDCDQAALINNLHRHDFDPFRGRPVNHWTWSRGWGLGALTPSRHGAVGGASLGVYSTPTSSAPDRQIPFYRGLPTGPTIPEVIRNARENLAQTVRLFRYKYNHTEASSPRQCTFLDPQTNDPSFNCSACLRRFVLYRDLLLLDDDIYLSEEKYRTLPEHARLCTSLGRDPTSAELQEERREYPCSWLRALTMMVGGRPSDNQVKANFEKHYATITGRLQMGESVDAAADEEAGEQEG
jgi:hypothetical protein